MKKIRSGIILSFFLTLCGCSKWCQCDRGYQSIAYSDTVFYRIRFEEASKDCSQLNRETAYVEPIRFDTSINQYIGGKVSQTVFCKE
jgi:hypothetical protein